MYKDSSKVPRGLENRTIPECLADICQDGASPETAHSFQIGCQPTAKPRLSVAAAAKGDGCSLAVQGEEGGQGLQCPTNKGGDEDTLPRRHRGKSEDDLEHCVDDQGDKDRCSLDCDEGPIARKGVLVGRRWWQAVARRTGKLPGCACFGGRCSKMAGMNAAARVVRRDTWLGDCARLYPR